MTQGGEIRVRFEDLAAAAGTVTGAAQRMNSQLEDLRRFLAPMVATWEGQASQDYQVRQRQWDDAAADLRVVLAQIGVALGHANDGYQQTETLNRRRWG